MERIGAQWPLYGLRLSIGGLEMRFPDEADLAELADLAREPLHDPGLMPFYVAWTDLPEEERARSVLQWNWRQRGEWSPEAWKLELVAVRDGVVVGTQGVHADRFSVTREVETGSWVGRRFQGQGVATAMRQAVLHLAFAGLGARAARSGAFVDNGASLRVSGRLGYENDGTETKVRRGEPGTVQRLIMTRATWEAVSPRWPPVTIEGLDPCLAQFGLEAGAPDFGQGM